MSYQGKNDTEISRELKVDYKTVRLWIQRVLDLGVKEGLVDKSRSGKPRVISAESRARVVSLACMKPKDLAYPHEIWTQRLLAEHIRENCIKEEHPDLSKINQGTISKILNASKINHIKLAVTLLKLIPILIKKQPMFWIHIEKQKTKWKKRKNEQIKTVIISYDENQVFRQLEMLIRILMPVEGHYSTIARDSEYKRHGTLSLLAGIDLISGRIYYKVFAHRSCEFIECSRKYTIKLGTQCNFCTRVRIVKVKEGNGNNYLYFRCFVCYVCQKKKISMT